MTPEERKIAARKELARRELARRELAKSEDATAEDPGATAEDPGVMDWLAGQVEPVMTTVSGMAAAPVSQIGGGIQMALEPIKARMEGRFQDPMAGPNARDRIAQALTYQPRSQTGKATMGRVGEILHPLASAMEKPREWGEEMYNAGAPEWAARGVAGLPEYAGAMVAALGMPKPKPKLPQLKTNPQTGDLVTAMSKDRLKPNINQRISDAGKLIKDPKIKPAIKSGWSEKLVGWAARQPKMARDKMREMVNIADDYFNKMDADQLPSDVIGKSAAQRIEFVNATRQKAGRAMDAIANGQLTKTRMDAAKLRSGMNIEIRRLGGKVTPDGINFPIKSKLYKQGGDAQALIDLHDKLNAIGRMPTGKELHDLKQWIDTYISYGKSPATKAEGISAASETVLKGVRRQVNEILRQNKPYAKANDIYSETKTALDTLQKGAGNIDMFGEGATESIGQVMRRLLSNAQSRTKVKQGVTKIGEIADKYSQGNLPFEDYTPQMRFLNEMERLWGPFKESSFKGEIAQAGQRIAENPSKMQAAREGVNVIKRIGGTDQSRARQLQTLKELLYQDGQ